MCRNGRYTERGIKERNGYGAERFRLEPEFAVRIDPALGLLGVLLEPASIVAKAWDHTERIGQRSRAWKPRTLMVTGAGPIGLLAALMGAQRGLDVHVLNRHASDLKSSLVRELGGSFHTDGMAAVDRVQPDILMECTGSPQLIGEVLARTASGGIVCLTGVTAAGHALPFDIGHYNRTMVLNNDAVFGTVNANRRHYELAAVALARAEKTWLARLITRRLPVERWPEAMRHSPDDIKVVIEFSD
jgi:threonine dehydrogenase-like Zn-dependent dehydrogenase